MSIDALMRQLERDAAAGVPPFGARSIELAGALGSRAVEALRTQIQSRRATAFLALEALRIVDVRTFDALPPDERADVYIRALKVNPFFNAWGVPGHHLTDTARAVIAMGRPILTQLRPLLDDDTPAPLSGSEDATTSDMYGNRVCDYAWVFISEILGRPYVYAMNARERDQQIAELRRTLQADDEVRR